MSRVALQDAVPVGLTAVTQYDPTLLGLICFISRLWVLPSDETTWEASLWIAPLFFLHVTEETAKVKKINK